MRAKEAKEVLEKLLEIFRGQQDECPGCDSEYVHDNGCPLEGRWFREELEEKEAE